MRWHECQEGGSHWPVPFAVKHPSSDDAGKQAVEQREAEDRQARRPLGYLRDTKHGGGQVDLKRLPPDVRVMAGGQRIDVVEKQRHPRAGMSLPLAAIACVSGAKRASSQPR